MRNQRKQFLHLVTPTNCSYCLKEMNFLENEMLNFRKMRKSGIGFDKRMGRKTKTMIPIQMWSVVSWTSAHHRHFTSTTNSLLNLKLKKIKNPQTTVHLNDGKRNQRQYTLSKYLLNLQFSIFKNYWILTFYTILPEKFIV